MNPRIPAPLQALVEQLARLPGLGPKSAMRMAMTLLKWPVAETRRLGRAVHDLRDTLHLCSRCGGLTAQDPCTVCADPTRQTNTLCLVAEWDSMLALEEGGFFHGQYLILGGLLQQGATMSATMDTHALELDRLTARLTEGHITELIMALGATVDADATGAYIRSVVARRFPTVRVTRLAQGIPLGGEVKFMDKETLRQSLQFRQEV